MIRECRKCGRRVKVKKNGLPYTHKVATTRGIAVCRGCKLTPWIVII